MKQEGTHASVNAPLVRKLAILLMPVAVRDERLVTQTAAFTRSSYRSRNWSFDSSFDQTFLSRLHFLLRPSTHISWPCFLCKLCRYRELII